MTTEERLARLELELTRVKRRNRWLLAGVALCFGIGLVAWTFVPQAATAQQQAVDVLDANVVRAKAFAVVGRDDLTCATLGPEPFLFMSDENGEIRIMLAVTPNDGPILEFYDADGETIWTAP